MDLDLDIDLDIDIDTVVSFDSPRVSNLFPFTQRSLPSIAFPLPLGKNLTVVLHQACYQPGAGAPQTTQGNMGTEGPVNRIVLKKALPLSTVNEA